MRCLTYTLGAQKNTRVWRVAPPCTHPEPRLARAGVTAPKEAGRETVCWASEGGETCLPKPRGTFTPAWPGAIPMGWERRSLRSPSFPPPRSDGRVLIPAPPGDSACCQGECRYLVLQHTYASGGWVVLGPLVMSRKKGEQPGYPRTCTRTSCGHEPHAWGPAAPRSQLETAREGVRANGEIWPQLKRSRWEQEVGMVGPARQEAPPW